MREILSTSGSGVSFRKVLKGATAGFVATAPMSISMLIGWRLLPTQEKYHLPPRLITEEITERAGIEDRLGEKDGDVDRDEHRRNQRRAAEETVCAEGDQHGRW